MKQDPFLVSFSLQKLPSIFSNFLQSRINAGQRTELLAIFKKQEGWKSAYVQFYEELPVGTRVNFKKSNAFFQLFGKGLDLRLKGATGSSPYSPNNHHDGKWTFQDFNLEIVCADFFHFCPSFTLINCSPLNHAKCL